MNNLILDQGSTFRRNWTYQTALGAPIDISGAVVRFQARLSNTEGVALIDLDSAGKGGVTLGGAAGTIDILVTASASAAYALSATSSTVSELQGDGSMRSAQGFLLVWALEMDLGGDTIRLDEGQMVITREVVR